jgi:hypothetical protein
MRIAHPTKVLAIAIAAMTVGSQLVNAEEYRVVPADKVTVCVPGSEQTMLDGPRDVSIARADGDKVDVAVCVADTSESAVNVRWKANGYWKSSGNVIGGCAEILGASKVKVRAVDTNFHQSATYSACVKE